jgi:hypothetical protein
MTAYSQSGWFKITEHRTWEDGASMIIGVLIVISPLISGFTGEGALLFNAGIVGAIVVAMAAMEIVALRRWEEWIELACGAWLLASPFVFQYGGALMAWHIALGLMVAILALLELWQDWQRKIET